MAMFQVMSKLCGALLTSVVVVGGVQAAGASSQNAASQTSAGMGFAEAYELALLNDPTLRAARAQTAGITERVAQAKAQLRPNVSLSVNRYKNDLTRTQANILGQTSTTDESYFSEGQSLVLRQPLYRPALLTGLAQAQAQVADAEALLVRETQTLAVRVAEAYLQVLAAQEKRALLTGQAKLVERQLDAARKKFDAGQGIRTDIDEAAAKLDLLKVQYLEATQTREGALLQLKAIVQTAVSEVQPLVPDAIEAAAGRFDSLAYWLDRAETQSPELAALKARVEAASLEVQRAESGHKPTLDLIAQVSRSSNENVTSPQSGYTNRQVGLQLNVPLYAGGGVQSAVRQAIAEQMRQEEVLEAARRDLAVRVQKEWRGVLEGQRRVSALMLAVASTDRVVVSTRRSFEGGVRTALDVLNAEQQNLQAQIDLNEARLAYVVARIKLLALAGDLDFGEVAAVGKWFRPV